MRCALSVGTMTAVGCDCTAARRRTARARCACCGAKPPRQVKYCPECGASYLGKVGIDTTVERRQVTFVYCDLVGSTSLSDEIDPEDYCDVLLTYRSAVVAGMSQFVGRVERYRGDGTLVYFGYPDAHEDDAERAIQALLETLGKVRAIRVPGVAPLGVRIGVRIGVATGLVVVAASGDAAQPAAMGNAPHIASRLQGVAEPDTIVIDDATHRVAGHLFIASH